MARQLVEVRFSDLGSAAAHGYTEGLRISLGYSALEALEGAIEGRVAKTAVASSDLADRFRDSHAEKVVLLLLGNLTNITLRTQIETLHSDARMEDVRCVAEGLRHLVFHGIFTPHGAGFGDSAHIRAFLTDLAEALLDATDARFTQWVERRG